MVLAVAGRREKPGGLLILIFIFKTQWYPAPWSVSFAVRQF
jgi:hypothetical protein